jgi:hypothetical protein
VLWYTYFGASLDQIPEDMAILADGSIVVIGQTNSSEGLYYPGGFPISSGTRFILRMDENGNRIWSSYFYANATLRQVEPLDNGDFILSGSAGESTDVASPGSQQTSSAGGVDMFFTRMTPDGEIVWSRYFGGPLMDNLLAIKCENGYLYGAGLTHSTSGIAFNTAEGNTFMGGPNDAILVKLDLNGNLIRARYFGGDGDDMFQAIDASGGFLALGGLSDSSNGINHGNHVLLDDPAPISAAFIASFNEELEIEWGTYHSSFVAVHDIKLDPSGNSWLAGYSVNGDDIEFNSGTTFNNDADGMIAQFLPSGELAMCGFYATGSSIDRIYSISLDETHLFAVGFTTSADMPVSEDAWLPNYAGSTDGLILRLALPVGVDEIADPSVSPVYPNPALDQLTIPSSAMMGVQELQVCDLTGRSVLHLSANHPGAATLHITSLLPGMYTIRAHNASGQAVWVQRWVKG